MLKWQKSLTALVLAASAALSLVSPALAAETAPDTPSGFTLNTAEHIAYMSGEGGLFRPDSSVSRAEAAQMLSCLLSQPAPAAAAYTDVPDGAEYAEAAGMMGYLGAIRAGESLFLPLEPITRGEFIHAVARFFPASAQAVQFADVSPDDPYAPDYLTARSLGWLTGFADGTLRPEQPVTRAEAASLLNRALGRTPDRTYIDGVGLLVYLDAGRNNWYYYDMLEASVAHEHIPGAEYGHAGEFWIGHTAEPLDLADGFHLIDNWLYCFDRSQGGLVRSASVGNFTFDGEGHFTSGSADLDARLREIVRAQTDSGMTQEQKLRALYVYTRDSFTYLRRPAYAFGAADFMQKDALDMLKNGYGNCYSYASLFWYLARWIGYDAKIYSGTVGTNKRPHSWVEINFDGRDYIFDTELEMAYRMKGRYEINLYKYIDVDNWEYIK